MRPTIRSLIVNDLHYCCVWAFFQIFRKTPEIAARLGFTDRAVRRVKAEVKGEKCEGCARCMKKQVRTVKIVGKRTLGL